MAGITGRSGHPCYWAEEVFGDNDRYGPYGYGPYGYPGDDGWGW